MASVRFKKAYVRFHAEAVISGKDLRGWFGIAAGGPVPEIPTITLGDKVYGKMVDFQPAHAAVAGWASQNAERFFGIFMRSEHALTTAASSHVLRDTMLYAGHIVLINDRSVFVPEAYVIYSEEKGGENTLDWFKTMYPWIR